MRPILKRLYMVFLFFVFVDSLDESQFVRLEKGTMLEITI